ncbi:MAG TPA: hypothetical protein VFA67_08010, partial [Candidatus Sulfotelmatobacter sp.]|nr:hypothetical protein [Candidatus Sulfotelmatobacter sp.]
TDTSATSFNGNYVFGALDFSGLGQTGPEFDFVGLGSLAAGAGSFTGTGLLSDPFGAFGGTAATYTAVPFSGTVTADTPNPGRYTIPLTIAPTGGATQSFNVVIYQASGEQLFWMDADSFGFWLGPMEQQGPLTGIPAIRKSTGKIKRAGQR